MRTTESVTLTIKAGSGGAESCDWVEMLRRMYLRWAESKKLVVKLTESLPGKNAGFERVKFWISGPESSKLRMEQGVHRLVRISPFDADARRHTSFALVCVDGVDEGWGESIRSYVLHPYQQIKDLRTNIETDAVEAVLDGDQLDMFLT